jgi:hypothetical protein
MKRKLGPLRIGSTLFPCPKTAALLPQNAAFTAAKINENARNLPQNPASIPAVSILFIGAGFFRESCRFAMRSI